MNRNITYVIPCEKAGLTIQQFLKEKGYTHGVIVLLKRTQNGIRRNGIWAKTSDILQSDDLLEILLCEVIADTSIIPENGALSIVYEDEDILVVDKPHHMPVHPSMGHVTQTLANVVCGYYQNQDELFTFRCINRLDRDTTGLTIIAKHMLSAGILGQSMKCRQIHRTYYAICQGKVPEEGTIDAPIARMAESIILRQVDDDHGESAITHYQRIQYHADEDLSLVKLTLDTGRTHQIRVHMNHIGHPLIGDFLYHPSSMQMSRQALHSGELEFIHPITNTKMHIKSPLPDDFKCFFPNF